MPKLVHPVVLTLLLQEPLHGYDLLQRMKDFELFDGEKPEPRGVYRTLQGMEEGGYVTSTWTSSARGPSRRLYTITDAGKSCLKQWVSTLRRYRLGLDALLTTAEETFFRVVVDND